MKLTRQARATDTVYDLVERDYNILPVLSRFAMPLGFGSMTIAEACTAANIDLDVFLLVVNFILCDKIDRELMERVKPLGVAAFLANSHTYFLNYKFPHIRRNLLDALDERQADINPAIVSFFDNYVTQVSGHFSYEESTLFPYVEALSCGTESVPFRIDDYVRNHVDEATEILSELKNVILRFYSTSIPNKMYDALVDICNCADDLEQHHSIENLILSPLVRRLEKQKSKGGATA
jgi:regulator of cell morphogenesis and NO signaling